MARSRQETGTFVLDDIPVQIHAGPFLARVGMRKDEKAVQVVQRMADSALRVGRPKAVYRMSRVESRGEDSVVIEGQTFRSRVLAVNLQTVYRVFPFVVTCGAELEDWSGTFDAPTDRIWSKLVTLAALEAALEALLTHIRREHHPGDLSKMNPGSLEDWPLSEQMPLFALLGDPESSIGVRLKEDFFMDPPMSTSGIWFPAEQSFENCMLCPLEDCPGRRAPYDRELYEEKYRKPRGGG